MEMIEFQLSYFNPKIGFSWDSAALNIPANLENSAVATGLEKVSFHSNPIERQCQRMLKVKVKLKLLSHVWLFATPWTVAYQAPLSMGFSRQECRSRLPFPSPGDLPNPGIKPGSPALQTDASPSGPPGKTKNAQTTAQLHSSHTLIK